MGTKSGLVAGAVFALVVGSGTAYAATGGNFILGKSNSAGATTTLSNGNGTALALKSRSGTPAFKVGNSVKVPNLNADRLDGKDSSSFASVAGRTGYVYGSGQWQDADGDGISDYVLAIAECPSGTQLTGGGLADYTVSGVLVSSQPFGAGGWGVVVMADPGQDSAADVESYAVCYNPRGAVRGATAARVASGTTLAPELQLRDKILSKMQ